MALAEAGAGVLQASAPMRIVHASDLHFGVHCRAEQVEALARFIETEPPDAIVLSGDLSQRTRRREFRQAAAFIRRLEARAPVMIVPGNHDCAWWTAFMGLGSRRAMFTRYRKLIRREVEPVMMVAGATFAGINSAQGIRWFTLTRRPRDLSVVGAVRRFQWERAKRVFAAAPVADVRILVLHHNLLPGPTSRRYGLATRARGLVDAAATGADLICCGHDHEQRVDRVEMGGRSFIVSTSGTLTNRTRGGRPGAWNLIEADDQAITATTHEWDGSGFRPAASVRCERRGGAAP